MISPADKERLAQQAAEAFQRRSQRLADMAHPGAQGGSKARPSVKKKGSSAKATKTATSAKQVANGFEVAPYLDAQGLSDLGNRIEGSENAKAAVVNDYTTQAAEAYRTAQQAGRDRTAGLAATDESMYARGLGKSSIRDAGLDKVDATYGQTLTNLHGNLKLKQIQGQGQLATQRRGDESFMAALAARAAELAGNVQRADTPFQATAQRKAKNVKGAVTKRRRQS